MCHICRLFKAYNIISSLEAHMIQWWPLIVFVFIVLMRIRQKDVVNINKIYCQFQVKSKWLYIYIIYPLTMTTQTWYTSQTKSHTWVSPDLCIVDLDSESCSWPTILLLIVLLLCFHRGKRVCPFLGAMENITFKEISEMKVKSTSIYILTHMVLLIDNS